MSRNSKRTSRVHTPEPAPMQVPTPPPQTVNNPFGINLVASTEVVDLPTKGKFYGENSSLHQVESVEIKHMTAREEDILSNEQFVSSGVVFDKLIESILVDKSINPKQLIATDKMAILYAARITGYGPEYVINMHCDACGADADFAFDLLKQEVVDDIPDGVTENVNSGTFSFSLPKTGLDVEVRILNTEDEKYLEDQEARSKKLGIPSNKTINLFRRVIVSVNNITDQEALNQLYENLPAIDSRKIKTVVNNITPFVSTRQSVACGSCGTESEREVPFTLGFFWPDI